MNLLARGQSGEVHVVQVDEADWGALLGYTWRTTPDGYVYRDTSRRIPGRPKPKSVRVYLHRHLLGLGVGDAREGNHLNRDPLDNRRENLAVVSHADNMRHWMKDEKAVPA